MEKVEVIRAIAVELMRLAEVLEELPSSRPTRPRLRILPEQSLDEINDEPSVGRTTFPDKVDDCDFVG